MSTCEWCLNNKAQHEVAILPKHENFADNQIALCDSCFQANEEPGDFDWKVLDFLNDAIWNENPKVKVFSYKFLKRKNDPESINFMEMMYLDDNELNWALKEVDNDMMVHKDCNEVVLQSGDNVTLIKDLKVKGSSLVAKQGTTVRKIRLDPNNAQFIEGKVDGQYIVIISEFVKKM